MYHEVNSPKIDTKLLNEEFVEVQKNMGNETIVKQVSKTKITAQDEEDNRLKRIEDMQNRKLNYADITKGVLKFTNIIRQP